MSRNRWILPAVAGAVALVLGLMIGRVVFGGRPSVDRQAHDSAPTNAAVPATWTCSMHPQIRRPDPGACPICGMDLIPVIEDTHGDKGARVLILSESAKAIAAVSTSRVIRMSPEVEVRMVGKLDFDETRLKTLSARFTARIERLYINYTGIRVNSGDHLAEIYSPDLLAAQRELLTAVEYDPDGLTAEVARGKLRLWDLLPEQIDGIIRNGTARDLFELKAPLGGVVVQKNVKEGDYVKTGDPLFRIADLSVLWLPLKAFESDLQWLRYGQKVAFQVESFPGESFEGRIVFFDPVLDDRTRTVGVRVEVPNPDGRLKPGMFARAIVYSHIASGGRVIAPELAGKWISPMHPEVIKDGPGQCDVCGMDLVPIEALGYVTTAGEALPLVVPASAVLLTGKRAIVYVALPDRERPTYEGREITIGPRAGDVFIVLEGLAEGEEIVTDGAFKIDSALQILARPSMMNPVGGGTAPAHLHGADPGKEPTTGVDSDDGSGREKLLALGVDGARRILPFYLDLQKALAGDALEAAKTALLAMLETVGPGATLAPILHPMLEADDLDGIRRPGFDQLSNAIIPVVRANPGILAGPLYLIHCPMVYPDHGADWLQEGEGVLNPYFGAAMLNCGETKERIAPP
ncbi:MAG: efflux RND transporter periplasmic adaptor subunit [Opitutaceae bacterium]